MPRKQLTKQQTPKRAGRPRTVTPSPNSLAAMLAAARTRAGLTVEQASERAGVDSTTWWRWERGAREPTISNLVAMARALRCSVIDLIPEAE